MAICSVKLSGSGCVDRKATCDLYTDQADCRKSTAGLCRWTDNCVAVDDPLDCTRIIGSSSILLSYEVC